MHFLDIRHNLITNMEIIDLTKDDVEIIDLTNDSEDDDFSIANSELTRRSLFNGDDFSDMMDLDLDDLDDIDSFVGYETDLSDDIIDEDTIMLCHHTADGAGVAVVVGSCKYCTPSLVV